MKAMVVYIGINRCYTPIYAEKTFRTKNPSNSSTF